MCGDWQHVQRDQGGRNAAQLVRAVSELKAGNDSSFNGRLHGLVVSPSDARGFKALRRVSLSVTSNRKVETHEMSTAARGGGTAVVATRSGRFVCMCERAKFCRASHVPFRILKSVSVTGFERPVSRTGSLQDKDF